MMEICDVKSKDWDHLIASSEAGTVFHSSDWTDFSTQEFQRIGILHREELLGGIILQVDGDGNGTLGSLAPYLGPVFVTNSHSSAVRKVLLKAKGLLAAHVFSSVKTPQFFSSPWDTSVHYFLVSGFRAYLLNTRIVRLSDLLATYSEFSSNLRRNIRSAESNGLSVQSGTVEDVISLCRKSFSRQQTVFWFCLDEVRRCLGHLSRTGRAGFFVTFNDAGSPIAAVAIVWDARRAYYILGGHDHENSHRGAHSLALWRAMSFVREVVNLEEFDLEGSHLPSVNRYFSHFGGDLRPFYFLEKGSLPFQTGGPKQ